MLNAGIQISEHLETLASSERDSHRRSQYNYILAQLKKGGSSISSLLQRTGLVPSYDIPLIEAGEKSGKLVQSFDMLSKYYQLSADTEKEIRSGLYYPLFLFSAVLLIPQLPAMILGEISVFQYLIRIALTLGITLGIAFYLFHLNRRSYFNENIARAKFSLFNRLPLLGNLVRGAALEKFCTSLAMMLESGVSLIESVRMAGQTSPSLEIQLAARRIAGEVKGGMSLPLAFSREPVFTQDIQNSITLGTKSGELPEFLSKTALRLRDEVARTITMLSKLIPQIVYFGVLGYAAWTIIGMHISNFRKLSNMF